MNPKYQLSAVSNLKPEELIKKTETILSVKYNILEYLDNKLVFEPGWWVFSRHKHFTLVDFGEIEFSGKNDETTIKFTYHVNVWVEVIVVPISIALGFVSNWFTLLWAAALLIQLGIKIALVKESAAAILDSIVK